MAGGIYLIQDNGQLVEMTEQAYDSEALLQKLLVNYPSLLGGDQIDSTAPRRWLLIKPEMEVPSEEDGYGRWFVDHLFLDQDGIPTLVEVKRSNDTRIRREVVGQMLDYAANAVVYWSVEKIIAQFEVNCQVNSKDPNSVLAEFLNTDADPSEFWQQVKTNLQAGKVRLIFIADKIPAELQRIVEFLNKQMNSAEVLAVEIKQYIGQNLKTLIPRVIGQTAEAQQLKSIVIREARQWDEYSFLHELETKAGIDSAKSAQRILDWISKKNLPVRWGKGKQHGSFIPRIISQKGKSRKLFAVWTNSTIEVYAYENPFNFEEKKTELLSRLSSIVGKAISVNAYNWYIPLAPLKDEFVLKQFLEVIDWAVQEIKAS